MPKEGERETVLYNTKVRTKLKGDGSWLQRRSETQAEPEEEVKPWVAEVRANRVNGAPIETSPGPSPTKPAPPLPSKPDAERAPTSGYLIRGIFTKLDEKSASSSTSNGSSGTTQFNKKPSESYKKIAPHTVRPTSENQEGLLSNEEQEKRTKAASSVLKTSAVRQRSYVLSAAKKYESNEKVPDTSLVTNNASFVAKRVEIVDDDEGDPTPPPVTSPSPTPVIPVTNVAPKPTPRRMSETKVKTAVDAIVDGPVAPKVPQPMPDLLKEDPPLVSVTQKDPFEGMKPGCTKVATPLPELIPVFVGAVSTKPGPKEPDVSERAGTSLVNLTPDLTTLVSTTPAVPESPAPLTPVMTSTVPKSPAPLSPVMTSTVQKSLVPLSPVLTSTVPKSPAPLSPAMTSTVPKSPAPLSPVMTSTVQKSLVPLSPVLTSTVPKSLAPLSPPMTSTVPKSLAPLSPPMTSTVPESLAPLSPPMTSTVPKSLAPLSPPMTSTVQKSLDPLSPPMTSTVPKSLDPLSPPMTSTVQKSPAPLSPPMTSTVQKSPAPLSPVMTSTVQKSLVPLSPVLTSTVPKSLAPLSPPMTSTVPESPAPVSTVTTITVKTETIPEPEEEPEPQSKPSPTSSRVDTLAAFYDTLVPFATSSTSLKDDEPELAKEQGGSADRRTTESRAAEEPTPVLSNCEPMIDDLLALDDGHLEVAEPVPPSPGRWSQDLLSGFDSEPNPAKTSGALDLLATDVIPINTETRSLSMQREEGKQTNETVVETQSLTDTITITTRTVTITDKSEEDKADPWSSHVTTVVTESSSADPFDPYPIGTTSPNSSSDLLQPLANISINRAPTTFMENKDLSPETNMSGNALKSLANDIIPINTDTPRLSTHRSWARTWDTITPQQTGTEESQEAEPEDQQTMIMFERKSKENDSPWDRWTSPTVYTITTEEEEEEEEEEESPADTLTQTVTTVTTIREIHGEPEPAMDRYETYSRTVMEEDRSVQTPEPETKKPFVYVKEYVNTSELSLHNARDEINRGSDYLTSSSNSYSYSSPSSYSSSSLSSTCTFCSEQVGNDAKITIEHLNINCHPACFKCGVCSKPMGDLLFSMFLHGGKVHCENCYSKALD